MFSLVITIVAVALVALLALAAIYYGATSYQSAGARARASTAISQSSQVLGASELHFVEKKAGIRILRLISAMRDKRGAYLEK